MITQDQFYEILDNKDAFRIQGIDHDFLAIKTLRERIPYEECSDIIGAAEHDKIFLCSVEVALKCLSVEDVEILAECNVGYEYDSLFLFV